LAIIKQGRPAETYSASLLSFNHLQIIKPSCYLILSLSHLDQVQKDNQRLLQAMKLPLALWQQQR
jgi:hypothetical protein